MITFSIITITYNASQVLPATLSSVMAQTCKDVEHIIIDGASADDT
ncbi:MAG: glycosyltransferase, partial [Prevotella sp.]|nr:glycosyltransferase [Prevotella sp.]